MRDFLISICPVAIWCIVACEAAVAVLLLVRYIKSKQPVALLSFLLTLGLILDAALIGLGSVLPAEVLKAVSPLIIPICGYALRLKKPVMIGVWAATGLLMCAGVAQAVATVLELREIAGVVRYASSAATPAWADTVSRVLSFGTVIPMMVAGIIVWIRRKNPHLFLSGFLMFAFSALGPATGNSDLIFFISMFGELLMVLFLYFYVLRECGKKAAGKSKKSKK